ncbi:hypothetical protein AM493_20080 [Flavobacterium akiainvivens]|uniref:Uncharacterized protein n=1 Tax=Flavobacterium akiainvivens TaxID=1202724 RepID=A0A0M8MLN5_9FLAO|nr:T9SS sorting signal type C domain-containing protein [Flavobacterium akiainvivens]KOS08088.1 hypothetical protein AM493_20080 [Flavobacterium akiainvivens]SFQ71711.1 hypothetical protein SAMN05444144_11723 [Flavobacterium akiainvivens]
MKRKLLQLAFVTMCNAALYGQTNITVGDGTGSGTFGPIASWYESSATESIYTGNEIGVSGEVTKLAYQKASGNSTTEPQVKIYMKQTSQAVIGQADYSIGATAFAGYTLVYEGTMPNNSTTGWMEVTLQTPFTVSAAQNLAILVVGSTCIESGRPQYRYTTSQGNKMSAGYDDGSIGCGGNNPWTSASVMEPVWERPNVRLAFGTLSAEGFTTANSLLYTEGGKLHFKSAVEVSSIAVYDVLGREVYSLKGINSTDVVLSALTAQNQVLFVKVTDAYNRTLTLKTVY